MGDVYHLFAGRPRLGPRSAVGSRTGPFRGPRWKPLPDRAGFQTMRCLFLQFYRALLPAASWERTEEADWPFSKRSIDKTASVPRSLGEAVEAAPSAAGLGSGRGGGFSSCSQALTPQPDRCQRPRLGPCLAAAHSCGTVRCPVCIEAFTQSLGKSIPPRPGHRSPSAAHSCAASATLEGRRADFAGGAGARARPARRGLLALGLVCESRPVLLPEAPGLLSSRPPSLDRENPGPRSAARPWLAYTTALLRSGRGRLSIMYFELVGRTGRTRRGDYTVRLPALYARADTERAPRLPRVPGGLDPRVPALLCRRYLRRPARARGNARRMRAVGGKDPPAATRPDSAEAAFSWMFPARSGMPEIPGRRSGAFLKIAVDDGEPEFVEYQCAAARLSLALRPSGGRR